MSSRVLLLLAPLFALASCRSAAQTSAAEFVFTGAHMKLSGAFVRGSNWIMPYCRVSESARGPAAIRENRVEVEFTPDPATEYSAWAYVGGCCEEIFRFQFSREGAGEPRTVELGAMGRLYHEWHPPEETAYRWVWVDLPLPHRYATGAPQKVRLHSDRNGFAVACILVTPWEQAPKGTPQVPGLPSHLVRPAGISFGNVPAPEEDALLLEADRLWPVDSAASIAIYQRLLREFRDTPAVQRARTRIQRRAEQADD